MRGFFLCNFLKKGNDMLIEDCWLLYIDHVTTLLDDKQL